MAELEDRLRETIYELRRKNERLEYKHEGVHHCYNVEGGEQA